MGKFEIKIGKTYSFKLTSRDEVVAKIVDITDDAYITETPLIVAVTQESLQLIPSMFTTELTNTMPIFKHAVSLICETREDVYSAYLESTTGIKVPPPSKILMG